MSTRKSFDNDTSRAIGKRLRAVRGDATQAEFAEKIGVDRATLANYESGRRIPNDVVLKKISELSGKTVPELIFGETRAPFNKFIENINKKIAEEAARRPGYIPRWTISDDEMALVVAFRIASLAEGSQMALKTIIEEATKILEQDAATTKLPVYGEGHIARLRAAYERGYLEEGYDPDQALFATLWEETLSPE